MVFNGLQNGDLILFNAILEMLDDDPRQWTPISYMALAFRCNCHPNTVYTNIHNLLDYDLIRRRNGHRDRRCYEYQLTDEAIRQIEAGG